MLLAIVPVAVTYEMKCNVAQTERLRAANTAQQAVIRMFESDRSDSGPSPPSTEKETQATQATHLSNLVNR